MSFIPIVTDDEVFNEAFIPQRLVCREGRIKEMARCLSPARSGKLIRNLFIHGPPGVGKTIVCRWLLNDGFYKKSAYVNCWSKRTSHKVWEEILSQMGFFINGKHSTSELVKKFENSRRKLLVCLDEADQLEDTDLLYVLARNSCGVILISNTPSFLSSLDGRVRSSLLLSEIEFNAYTKEEVLEIVKERASCGIRPGSISDSLMNIIATMAGGDARVGLQILKAAAADAESKGLSSITIEEIKSASKFARKYRLSYLLRKLNDHQRAVYAILKNGRSMKSGELYSEYRKAMKNPVVDRAYRKSMQRLEQMGLVRSFGAGRWKKYEIVG